jgi:signal transduction histidine kinase
VNHPWFLRRRITTAFGLTAFLISSALTLPFGWILRTTIDEEIAALVREELEETRAHFGTRLPSPAELATITAELQREHAATPLAWRFWGEPGGKPYFEAGASELGRALESVARDPDAAGHQGDLHFGFARLDERMQLGIALDASALERRFSRSIWAAFLFLVLATAVATLAGRLVALRVSRLLESVAASAGTEGVEARWPEPGEAPEEIRAVVSALQDSLRRIRKESEDARLLVSGMAHELRSPLQNLMGESQVALLREREPGEYRRVLESQLEDLGELSRVVDNLVTLSSIDESRRRRSVEHFDLAAEAWLRLARERKLAERRGVQLRLHHEGNLAVEGDRESLLLALRNVVTNAIEWSPAGAAVELRMRGGERELEILIDDAGPGVRSEDREKIFRPFHRGPAAEGRRVGFGLGLALTDSAVRAHGGRIEVSVAPAGGARFRILLPRRAVA